MAWQTKCVPCLSFSSTPSSPAPVGRGRLSSFHAARRNRVHVKIAHTRLLLKLNYPKITEHVWQSSRCERYAPCCTRGMGRNKEAGAFYCWEYSRELQRDFGLLRPEIPQKSAKSLRRPRGFKKSEKSQERVTKVSCLTRFLALLWLFLDFLDPGAGRPQETLFLFDFRECSQCHCHQFQNDQTDLFQPTRASPLSSCPLFEAILVMVSGWSINGIPHAHGGRVQEANTKGERISTKRVPEGPKPMKIVKAL